MNTNTMAAADKPYITVGTTPTVQYIVLSKSRVAGESQFLVPYRLIVKVVGKAGTGAPDYVAPPTPTVTPTARPSPTAVASATRRRGLSPKRATVCPRVSSSAWRSLPSSSAHSVPSSCSPFAAAAGSRRQRPGLEVSSVRTSARGTEGAASSSQSSGVRPRRSSASGSAPESMSNRTVCRKPALAA